MKVRGSFVTNSSTTNFVVVNITKENLSLRDFFLENMSLVQNFMEQQVAGDISGEDDEVDENLDAWLRNVQIGPFGIYHADLSEACDTTDVVLKIMEPGSGKSKSFIWKRERE